MAAAERRREDWPREFTCTAGHAPAGRARRGFWRSIMLHYAVIFLIRAMAAAVLGFSAVA
jgi:hypothetical protein